jgi:hypothetical protein
MRRFVISVSDRAFQTLAELAQQERRLIKDQAAWLLERQVLGGVGNHALPEAAVSETEPLTEAIPQ